MSDFEKEMVVIESDDLDETIDSYTKQLGYRLDMIVPADAPREALVSKDGVSLRIVSEPPVVTGGLPSNQGDRSSDGRSATSTRASANPPVTTGGSDFVRGRAGMEYRDLIPGRLGGKVIVSHIRLTNGGEVPDYVHYHKVDFQLIYCNRGRIRVVYEDQGPPFWLETGDCVLQPPEIRHRVLECTAGAEVIEVSMPAEHETWVEHDITLPTAEVKPDRIFNRQRFVRHIAADAKWKHSEFDGFEVRDTEISASTDGVADVRVFRPTRPDVTLNAEPFFIFPLDQDGILAVRLWTAA